jgi:hypothetical protein
MTTHASDDTIPASGNILSSKGGSDSVRREDQFCRPQAAINDAGISLEFVISKLQDLLARVPSIPATAISLDSDDIRSESDMSTTSGSNNFVSETAELKLWARNFCLVLDEYETLLALADAATYRSLVPICEEALQTLSRLHGEMAVSMLHIQTHIKPAFTNYVLPETLVVLDQVVQDMDDEGRLVQKTLYQTILRNPDTHVYAAKLLCKNADSLRKLFIANIERFIQVLQYAPE